MTTSDYVMVPREKLELAIKMIDRNMHHQWEKVADAASILRNVLSDAPASPASPVSPSHPRDEVVEALATFRNADELDWDYLFGLIQWRDDEAAGDRRPAFWKAVFTEFLPKYRLALSKLEFSHG